MPKKFYLHVGGVVAMGFALGGEYLFVVSHSGRGVFSTRTWERVARDSTPEYPEDGFGIGIGPIAGVKIAVTELDFETEKLSLNSPDGLLTLDYESGTITIVDNRT